MTFAIRLLWMLRGHRPVLSKRH